MAEQVQNFFRDATTLFTNVTIGVALYFLIMTAIIIITFLLVLVLFFQNMSIKRTLKKIKKQLIPSLPKEKRKYFISNMKKQKSDSETFIDTDHISDLDLIVEKINYLSGLDSVTEEDLKSISILVEEEKKRLGKTSAEKRTLNEALAQLIKIMARSRTLNA